MIAWAYQTLDSPCPLLVTQTKILPRKYARQKTPIRSTIGTYGRQCCWLVSWTWYPVLLGSHQIPLWPLSRFVPGSPLFNSSRAPLHSLLARVLFSLFSLADTRYNLHSASTINMAFTICESLSNRPSPSSLQPPFQSEAKCKVFVMKISFHSDCNWN